MRLIVQRYNGKPFTVVLKHLILWLTIYQLDYRTSKPLTMGIHLIMSGPVSDSRN